MYKVANEITHKLTFEEFLIHISPWISIKIVIFWCTWLRNLWRRRTVYQSCGIFYMQQWLVQIQCLFMWSQSLDLHACCKSIYFYAIPYTQIHKCLTLQEQEWKIYSQSFLVLQHITQCSFKLPCPSIKQLVIESQWTVLSKWNRGSTVIKTKWKVSTLITSATWLLL